MTNRRNVGRYSVMLLCLLCSLGLAAAQDAAQPETVMITLRAKSGAEADLERVIARHWTTARQMNLVRDLPHVTIRSTEDGNKAYFIDIFTWRDAHIPDAAPPEIRTIWTDMHRLVEARGGRPGLEIAVVSLVAP